MLKPVTRAAILALASTVFANFPAEARDYDPGRVDTIAAACRVLAKESADSFSVGTCLTLEIENSTNELSTLCAWAKQEGLLSEEFETVAQCIEYFQSSEE